MSCLLERPSQPPDDNTTCPIVGRSFNLIIDVKNELRHVVVPVEIDDGVWGEPAAAGDINRCRSCCRQVVDIVQHRREYSRGRQGSLRDPVLKASEGVLFSMYNEQSTANGAPRGDPALELRPVGMPGIFVDVPNSRFELDFIALDSDRLCTVEQEAA